MRPIVVALALLWAGGCQSSIGSAHPGGFETRSVQLCGTGTDSVGLRTESGGRLILEVLDACGTVLSRCEPPDVYAPDARTSIRVSGTDLIVEGCAASAAGGTTVRAAFVSADGGAELEEHRAAVLADCRDGGIVEDASCPADGGSVDAAVLDAAFLVDGGGHDAAAIDAGP